MGDGKDSRDSGANTSGRALQESDSIAGIVLSTTSKPKEAVAASKDNLSTKRKADDEPAVSGKSSAASSSGDASAKSKSKDFGGDRHVKESGDGAAGMENNDDDDADDVGVGVDGDGDGDVDDKGNSNGADANGTGDGDGGKGKGNDDKEDGDDDNDDNDDGDAIEDDDNIITVGEFEFIIGSTLEEVEVS